MPALFRSLAFLFFFLLFHSGSLATEELAGSPVSSGVRYQPHGTYSVEQLNKILKTELAEFSNFPATFPEARTAVKLYRVIYPSVIPELGNKSTIATGLLAIPEKRAAGNPVVSYQHGTVFSKAEVPSFPEESMETRLMLAQFAGQGYVVVAADYFGKGESWEKDSYLVKESTQQACLDMLNAAKGVSRHLKTPWGPLFLSGWSQGGWATMVFLNKLESENIPVTAAATASAPQDLYAIINGWMNRPKESDASFLSGLLALQLHAYAEYYRLPGLAESFIRPEFQIAARDLYANKLTWEQAALPKWLPAFLQEDILVQPQRASRYWEILQANQAYRWRSVTPLRIYYGAQDEVVPPYIATLPVGFQKQVGGAETTAIEVTGDKATHRGTFVYQVGEAKKWFDSLLEKPAVSN